MAVTEENMQQADETILIAHVTVHLHSGESFGLLPFEDANDVKSPVRDLIADWAKSGFLIYGSRIYPWHQVRLVEATQVEELPRRESEQRLEERQAFDLACLRQSVWKTKKACEKKEDGKSEDSHEDQKPE
jgi:hypothetical protein